MKPYVITIAREFGSGGKEIATKLSEILEIPYYEEQILQMASVESGINEELFNQADEKLKGSYFINMMKGEPKTYEVLPSDKEFISNNNLYHIQSGIIRNLAATGSCIIVGKCADDVLKEFDNLISVFVTGSFDYCVNSVMKKMVVEKKEAEKLVKRTNKYRSEYYKYYTNGKEWKNPKNFSMMLNSEKIGRDNCVDIICDTVKKLYFD